MVNLQIGQIVVFNGVNYVCDIMRKANIGETGALNTVVWVKFPE